MFHASQLLQNDIIGAAGHKLFKSLFLTGIKEGIIFILTWSNQYTIILLT